MVHQSMPRPPPPPPQWNVLAFETTPARGAGMGGGGGLKWQLLRCRQSNWAVQGVGEGRGTAAAFCALVPLPVVVVVDVALRCLLKYLCMQIRATKSNAKTKQNKTKRNKTKSNAMKSKDKLVPLSVPPPLSPSLSPLHLPHCKSLRHFLI